MTRRSNKLSGFIVSASLTRRRKPNKQNLKPSRRSYDFEIDADALYTSFREAYGIDLLQEDLHWWAFRELMLGLPDDTPFKQRVYYRTGSTEGMSAKQKSSLRLGAQSTQFPSAVQSITS